MAAAEHRQATREQAFVPPNEKKSKKRSEGTRKAIKLLLNYLDVGI